MGIFDKLFNREDRDVTSRDIKIALRGVERERRKKQLDLRKLTNKRNDTLSKLKNARKENNREEVDFLFEDLRYQWPDVNEIAFLDQLCEAMKPGAVLAIVDHVADPGGDASAIAQTIHRIDPETVRADVTGSCFELVEESFILRNPQDDHTLNTVEGPMVGKSDRFMHKYVRR